MRASVCPKLCPERCAHEMTGDNGPKDWCRWQLALKATVDTCSPVPLRHEQALSCKYLRNVYLNVRGEVAERLKAAVC
jgi:hypothetical protein